MANEHNQAPETMPDEEDARHLSMGPGGSFPREPEHVPPQFEEGIAERGVPGVGKTRRSKAVFGLVITVLVMGVIAFGAFGVSRALNNWKDHEVAAHEAARAAIRKGSDIATPEHDFNADKAEQAKKEAEQARIASEVAAANAASAAAAQPVPVHADRPAAGAPVNGGSYAGGANGAAAANAASQATTPAQRRLEGDVLVTGADSNPRVAGSSRNDNLGTRPLAAADGLDGKLRPSELAPVKAEFLPNLDYLLTRGSTILCAQNTEIVTDYPGLISCHVTKDVYSANGKVLLIERGSEVTGEQRQALMQGQARIFTIWTRLVTPNGVAVELDSPGADQLGGSGLPAYVDTHFWTRFGGAIFVSLIGDFGQALSSLASNSGGGSNRIQFNGTTGATESIASETLRNTINVPPTAYSNVGSVLTIFVARDVDFSSVYELVTP